MLHAVGGIAYEARRRLAELERIEREELAFLRLVAERRPELRARIEGLLRSHEILKVALRIIVDAERAHKK